MPSNIKNRPLTVDIQEYITQIILQHPNHTVILCRDFNRNMALIGRHLNNVFIPHNNKRLNGQITLTPKIPWYFLPNFANFDIVGKINFSNYKSVRI